MRPCLRSAQPLGRRFPEASRPLAGGRLQIIDGLHAVELTFHYVELRSELGDRAPMAHVIAIEMTEDLAASLDHRVVFDGAGFVEERDDLVFRHCLDAI